jgi:beta-lactamase regulating signal transducer with metallopeptidase domain
MSINVFEGARRMAKLITLLWVVGCVIYTIEDVLDLRKQSIEAQAQQPQEQPKTLQIDP